MVPKRVFIVPYRNRIHHKYFFSIYMTDVILKDQFDYEIYFSHQNDTRPFNRGGVKNIGFMAVKQKYPNDYKDITFIFNDIDTVPFSNIFNYETTTNIVKHYYGFTYALGGIVAIKGRDFEKINGYPCYWGWGNEDNLLNNRCITNGITIDRSEFLPIGSPQILQLFDGISRLINKSDFIRAFKDNGLDGLCTISNIQYTIDTNSLNENDNVFKVDHPNIFYININNFKPLIPVDVDTYSKYDLRKKSSTIKLNTKMDILNKDFETPNDIATIQDWTIIPTIPINANDINAPFLQNINILKQQQLTTQMIPITQNPRISSNNVFTKARNHKMLFF